MGEAKGARGRHIKITKGPFTLLASSKGQQKRNSLRLTKLESTAQRYCVLLSFLSSFALTITSEKRNLL